jgi:hypothetical protein
LAAARGERNTECRGAIRFFGKEAPETVEVRGKALRCQLCKHELFGQRRAQRHSGVATFFNLEWASPTCSACGDVHWFFPQD